MLSTLNAKQKPNKTKQNKNHSDERTFAFAAAADAATDSFFFHRHRRLLSSFFLLSCTILRILIDMLYMRLGCELFAGVFVLRTCYTHTHDSAESKMLSIVLLFFCLSTIAN